MADQVTFLNYSIDESNNVYFYEDKVTAPTVLSKGEGLHDRKTLSTGWYVATDELIYKGAFGLEILGDVKLILADGCNLKPNGIYVGKDSKLTIYSGVQGTGICRSRVIKEGPLCGIEVRGSLTIVGGNVTGEAGGIGAGIGSTYKGDAVPEITIVGGNVTAKAYSNAAGIGGGDDSHVENITIYSGVVNATGARYGAGIGGGDGHNHDENTGTFENITINGGDITATGGEKGAGIGSGATAGKSGTITINGGKVTATTSQKSITKQSGAGIGGGGSSKLDGVYINGGFVTATTGNKSSIGAGTGSEKDASCGTVKVSGDMTLTKDKTTVAHTSDQNLVSTLSGSKEAVAELKSHSVSGTTETINDTTVTQSGSFYGSGYYTIAADGNLTGGNNVTFENIVLNSTLAQGGAIYNKGSVVLDGETSPYTLNFENIKAIGNEKGAQGGVLYNAGTASISHAAFTDNYATCWKGNSQGGAIYNAAGATLSLSDVSFSGNKATTQGGAVYNAGTLNIDGWVTLSTSSDTLYNTGTLTWDLSRNAKIDGYEFVTNITTARQVLTIDAETEQNLIKGGNIKFASGNLKGWNFPKFTLTGIEGREDVTLTVNGDHVLYGDCEYFLGKVSGSKDEFFLTIINRDKLQVTRGDCWFQADEPVTITGVAPQDVTTVKVSGCGDAVTAEVDEETRTWSCTLSNAGETAGTELTIEGFNADGTENAGTAEAACETTYTLKRDTVAPTLTMSLSNQGYVKEDDDVHWYKQGDDTVTFSATVADETSGVRFMELNGEDYTGGTSRTLDTSVEISKVNSQTFAAQDHAGNESTDGFRYGVDGSGPTVGETVFVDGENEAYVDENGIAWFQQGAADAALKAEITDNLSGLAEAFFTSWYDQETGSFAIDTNTEEAIFSSDIEAVDNVGNTSETEEHYSYGIDGSGPEIGDGTFEGDTLYADANGKTWFRKGDATAALVAGITDILSGLKEAVFAGVQYEDGKFMLADAVPTEDCRITATDNVGNVSEKSQTAAGVSYSLGIDAEGPAITISTDPAADLAQNVTVTVSCEDSQSGVKADSIEYALNSGDYQKYTGSFTVTANDLITVRAADNVGNVSTESYQVANICAKSGADYVAPAGRTITIAAGNEYRLNSLTLEEGSSFTLGRNAKVCAKTTRMQGGTLDTANGIMLGETLKVESGMDNKLVGILAEGYSVSNVLIDAGAGLTVSKDQFDNLMQFTDYASSGKLVVSAVEGNALTEDNIRALIGKTAAGMVSFDQDLTGIHKLTIKTDKISVIGFQNGYGTEKSDTLRFARLSNTIFGNTGYTIDLGKGSNKVQVDQNAVMFMKSNLSNVSTIRIDKNTLVEMEEIKFADGRNAFLRIGSGASVAAGNAEGGDRKLTVFSEKASSLKMDNITAAAASDTIFIGNSSSFSAENLSGVETIRLGAYSQTTVAGDISGTRKLLVSSGKKDSIATLSAARVTGTAGNDSFIIGNFNDVDLTSLDFGEGNDMLRIGSYADVDISSLDFGEGKDTLSIGKGAALTVDSLDVEGLEKLAMSSGATLAISNEDDLKAARDKWSRYAGQIVEA